MSKSTALRKRAAALVGATALLVGGGIATAGPAAADYMCDPGYHCLYWGGYIGDSASHDYYNSDADFRNDTFNTNPGTGGYGQTVDDNVSSVSNASTGGYETHLYRDPGYAGGLLFCVNPGSEAWGADLADFTQEDQASSMKLRPSTTIHCF
ncbi:peptidase inhibitor family I36 protein [Streptomyces solicathayae]|uniref:Peptidase inhibitor family I36 protein n=1 Tax=Streptomyces solicathayae TaxID=3081768 RepID=A0ABZ0LYW7_9ACTN|nr:peptidase inhibitor family I36 protein [Streptomyces sp. HUAS YS2]WOX24634.1 peptidase inhibitor family I36 protein [Streptomyces sp. HUAS YS2]